MPTAPARIGFFSIGQRAYWPQFAGLKERLAGYHARIAARLVGLGAEVTDAGMVDHPDASRAAGERFAAAGCDVVFCYLATYALSHDVLPAFQRCGRPVVVLALQPGERLDYAAFNAMGDRGAMTGDWLAWCQACSAPEVANVARRARIPFHQVHGFLDDPQAWGEITGWVRAAGVRRGMADNRVGVLGHYYNGMLDVHSDCTLQAATFGCHIELIEMDELVDLRRRLTEAEVVAARAALATAFAIDPDCGEAELERAARTAAALRRLVDSRRLGSLAYYYEGVAGDESQDVITSIIPGNTLLTASGVPVAGECEVKNVQAMKILDLAGCGGSFSEFYLTDFADDVVMLGHDGPGHAAIAEDGVRLVPLPVFHGKPGSGLSIEMQVKTGPVTLLSVVQDGDGRLSLLTAEGEAVAGPTLDIGNTNSRYRFSIGARAFIEAWSSAGPAHHVAIGTGHQAAWIANLADLLGIGVVRVC